MGRSVIARPPGGHRYFFFVLQPRASLESRASVAEGPLCYTSFAGWPQGTAGPVPPGAREGKSPGPATSTTTAFRPLTHRHGGLGCACIPGPVLDLNRHRVGTGTAPFFESRLQ